MTKEQSTQRRIRSLFLLHDGKWNIRNLPQLDHSRELTPRFKSSSILSLHLSGLHLLLSAPRACQQNLEFSLKVFSVCFFLGCIHFALFRKYHDERVTFFFWFSVFPRKIVHYSRLTRVIVHKKIVQK